MVALETKSVQVGELLLSMIGFENTLSKREFRVSCSKSKSNSKSFEVNLLLYESLKGSKA